MHFMTLYYLQWGLMGSGADWYRQLGEHWLECRRTRDLEDGSTLRHWDEYGFCTRNIQQQMVIKEENPSPPLWAETPTGLAGGCRRFKLPSFLSKGTLFHMGNVEDNQNFGGIADSSRAVSQQPSYSHERAREKDGKNIRFMGDQQLPSNKRRKIACGTNLVSLASVMTSRSSQYIT